METPKKKSTEKFVKDIRKNTRRIFTSEQKILIVMEGLRAETSVAELCRQHSIYSLFSCMLMQQRSKLHTPYKTCTWSDGYDDKALLKSASISGNTAIVTIQITSLDNKVKDKMFRFDMSTDKVTEVLY